MHKPVEPFSINANYTHILVDTNKFVAGKNETEAHAVPNEVHNYMSSNLLNINI